MILRSAHVVSIRTDIERNKQYARLCCAVPCRALNTNTSARARQCVPLQQQHNRLRCHATMMGCVLVCVHEISHCALRCMRVVSGSFETDYSRMDANNITYEAFGLSVYSPIHQYLLDIPAIQYYLYRVQLLIRLSVYIIFFLVKLSIQVLLNHEKNKKKEEIKHKT